MFQPVQVLAPKILAAAMASFFASYGVPGPRCFVVRLFGARAPRGGEGLAGRFCAGPKASIKSGRCAEKPRGSTKINLSSGHAGERAAGSNSRRKEPQLYHAVRSNVSHSSLLASHTASRIAHTRRRLPKEVRPKRYAALAHWALAIGRGRRADHPLSKETCPSRAEHAPAPADESVAADGLLDRGPQPG